jgi:hypothetical protein
MSIFLYYGVCIFVFVNTIIQISVVRSGQMKVVQHNISFTIHTSLRFGDVRLKYNSIMRTNVPLRLFRLVNG